MKRFITSMAAVCMVLFSAMLIAAPPAQSDDAYIDGELLIVHIDYADSNSEYAYHVKEKGTGEVFELKFDRKAPRGLHTGDKITVRGKLSDKKIYVQDLTGAEEEPGDVEPADAASEAGAAVPRKAIYMVVNFSNSTSPSYFTSTDRTNAANRMFYDTYSVDKVYQEGSFGKLAFPPPESSGGKAVGPLSITAPTDTSGNITCDYYAIASRADAAAAASPFN